MTEHTCLNWSGAGHWSNRREPCIHCGSATNLRDTAGRPSHKVCCERALDQLRAVSEPGPVRLTVVQ